jgi:hypothetical protein
MSHHVHKAMKQILSLVAAGQLSPPAAKVCPPHERRGGIIGGRKKPSGQEGSFALLGIELTRHIET